MTADRRQHERFVLLAQVELRHSGQIEILQTINISAGGLLMVNERNVKFAIGDQIRIGFNAPELAPAFSIDATVVRVVGPTAKPALLAAMWASSEASANKGLEQILWNLRKL